MALPKSLKAAVFTARFWTDYLRLTEPEHDGVYADLVNCVQEFPQELVALGLVPPELVARYDLRRKTIRIVFPVGSVHSLVLDVSTVLGDVDLFLRDQEGDSDPIAWTDGHFHPHLFRWEELDQICRCVALSDLSFSHPGIPLLFLYRFAPICDEKDANFARPLLQDAWRFLRVMPEEHIKTLVGYTDVRGCGFRWQYDTAFGWTLHQNEWGQGGRYLYTIRAPGGDKFLFRRYDALLAAASAVCRNLQAAAGEQKAAADGGRNPGS